MPTTISGTTGVNLIQDGTIVAADFASSTGSGATVLATSPTITTPIIATPTITNATITVASTAAPAFYAYLGSQQAISASTVTKITLSSELFDTNSNFDSSTNYRFTPTVAGYYQITANARIIGTSASNKTLILYKNGSQFISSDTYSGSSGNLSQYMSFSLSSLIYFNGSTDYIELYGYSNGASTALDGGGGGVNTAPWQTYMSGAFVRSA